MLRLLERPPQTKCYFHFKADSVMLVYNDVIQVVHDCTYSSGGSDATKENTQRIV